MNTFPFPLHLSPDWPKVAGALALTAVVGLGGVLGYKHYIQPSHGHFLIPVVQNSPSKTTLEGQNATSNSRQVATSVATSSSLEISVQDQKKGIYKASDGADGLAFEYRHDLDNGGDQTIIEVQKQGNRILLYPKDSPQNYDLIQVFSKSASDTLAEAISKTILNGYSPEACVIGRAYGVSPGEYPVTMQTASIKYAQANTYAESGHPIDASKCPAEYAAVETPRYFLMDSNHPNKFVFIQNGIPIDAGTDSAGNLRGWESTLTLF